jgi:hypothetical protein
MKTAIGASYCVDRTPGGERVGGLMVKLQRRTGDAGKIEIIPTDWRTGEPLAGIDVFIKEVERGLFDAAKETGADLKELDVQLTDFVYHDVDSWGGCYYGAARSAFRSAWDAWRRYYKVFDKDSRDSSAS